MPLFYIDRQDGIFQFQQDKNVSNSFYSTSILGSKQQYRRKPTKWNCNQIHCLFTLRLAGNKRSKIKCIMQKIYPLSNIVRLLERDTIHMQKMQYLTMKREPTSISTFSKMSSV